MAKIYYYCPLNGGLEEISNKTVCDARNGVVEVYKWALFVSCFLYKVACYLSKLSSCDIGNYNKMTVVVRKLFLCGLPFKSTFSTNSFVIVVSRWPSQKRAFLAKRCKEELGNRVIVTVQQIIQVVPGPLLCYPQFFKNIYNTCSRSHSTDTIFTFFALTNLGICLYVKIFHTTGVVDQVNEVEILPRVT